MFEAGADVGGHSYTFPVEDPAGTQQVDMGFIVFNERTYPNFCRLLSELDVATEESCMSFSVRSERKGFEWNGSDLGGIFAQRRSLLRPSVYRMLFGILRFHRRASDLLQLDPQVTLGSVLDMERWRGPFVDLYLVPMVSAIWSTDPRQVLEMPARALFAFLHNHGMLAVSDRPAWRVVAGGSRRYVTSLVAPFRHRIDTTTPVASLRRRSDGVELALDGTRRGEIYRADAVVLACHADQALRLLADPTPAEHDVLAAVPYSRNDVVLHTDSRLMPRSRRAWASWNYHHELPARELAEATASSLGTSRVTYWMNRLQNLGAERDYLVSLNRTPAIDPEKILHRATFDHPLFTADGMKAQSRWHEISLSRTVYCGAYWGFGFHEDGVKSGLRAARALGAVVDGVGLDELGRDGFGGAPPAGVAVEPTGPGKPAAPDRRESKVA